MTTLRAAVVTLAVIMNSIGIVRMWGALEDVIAAEKLTRSRQWTFSQQVEWCRQAIELNQGFVCPDLRSFSFNPGDAP